MVKIISWNLLRLVGASLGDVARLIRRNGPDLLLMQEATEEMDGLPLLLGGHYHRASLPGRVHGLAVHRGAYLAAHCPPFSRLSMCAAMRSLSGTDSQTRYHRTRASWSNPHAWPMAARRL